MAARDDVERVHLDEFGLAEGLGSPDFTRPTSAGPQTLPSEHEAAGDCLRDRGEGHDGA